MNFGLDIHAAVCKNFDSPGFRLAPPSDQILFDPLWLPLSALVYDQIHVKLIPICLSLTWYLVLT